MSTRLAALRNYVLTQTTNASSGIIHTTPTLTVVSPATDTITTDSTILSCNNTTTDLAKSSSSPAVASSAAVVSQATVTRDSSSCHTTQEEYQFITTECLQDVLAHKALTEEHLHHQHHHPQQQQSQSLQQQQQQQQLQEEVAVINVVVPMDNTDNSSNEAQATMDSLNALKEGVVDLVHHSEQDEGCPQFITVTVSTQDAGQNYQVQYVDAEQLYQATNATQTQISYPFCPIQEYQANQSTFYTTTTGNYNPTDNQLTGNTEQATTTLLPYLVPVEEGMLINTSSEDIHSSPQTPNSSTNTMMGTQCLNSANEQELDDNSMETTDHNMLASSNKIASATIKWLSQNYETAEGVSLPRSTLYTHYMHHCNEHKIEPVNAASFGKLIRSVFSGLRTRRLGTRGNSKYHYYGIRIKPDSMLKQQQSLDEKSNSPIKTSSQHSSNVNHSANNHASQSGSSSSAHPHHSNKLSKKLIFKPESYEACAKFLGDGAGAIPIFPQLELDQTYPAEISAHDIEMFRLKYQEHCEKFLDAIINLEFNTIEYLWREFWSADYHDQSQNLSQTKLQLLCLSSTLQTFVRELDYQFYQNMVDVIIPDVLRSIPNALTQAIRSFAKNMELWLAESMVGIPEQMIQIKTSAVSAFCQTLRRYTSLNHLAQAARAVLQNGAQISQMLSDLNRVDFHNVQEQAAWVCQCDPLMVQRFENDFKAALQQQSSLEQWASWLQLVVDTSLQEYRGKPSYSKAARQFLLKWSFYSSMIIRDLTLRSASSFGSFHLIRLLYDEYMFYLVEHKIAEAQEKTAIAVICDRIQKDVEFELDYQLEFISEEPQEKRVGAKDSLTGYTVLVSVAHTLSRLLADKTQLKDSKLNIMFVIFNGESYDYIGSQRFIYDLENKDFPLPSTRTTAITLENIEFVLDLGTFDEMSSIKLHTISEFPYAKMILRKLQHYATTPKYDFNINFESSIGYQMPPTSAQSFLRKNLSFPAAILNAPPTNRFYHSVYDDGVNLKYNYTNTSLDYTRLMGREEALKYFKTHDIQMKIRNVSAVIAMALFDTLTGKEYVDDQFPSPVLIDEILYCFIKSQNCPLFYAASKPNSFKKLPLIAPNRYISVNRDTQEATIWTYRIMGYLLSQKLNNVSKENCTYLPRHWFAGYNNQGVCGITTQNYSLALSPAFIIEDYNWTSGEYSTWSESTWNALSSRLFLRPSRIHETITLTIGVVVLIFSFCLVYIISTRSEVLFEDPGPNASTDALNPPTAC